MLFYLVLALSYPYDRRALAATTIPEPFPSIETCQKAGELAASQMGRSIQVQYTCVPTPKN